LPHTGAAWEAGEKVQSASKKIRSRSDFFCLMPILKPMPEFKPLLAYKVHGAFRKRV